MKLPKITNSQYVRALTDNQLAKIIMCPYNQACHGFNNCVECATDWLRKPFNEENEDDNEDY